MKYIKRIRIVLIGVLVLGLCRPAVSQTFPFTSGPIPLCDTSTFTATVSGVGFLIIPDGWNWGPFLDNVLINITTDHPQTLQISLTSPAGTTLLLSEFNGAGGQNYTNTTFTNWAGNITSGSAPFTGYFSPQGGTLDVFGNSNADGVWTITVIDTACANGGTGPGGNWTPGWFTGGAGTGAFSFGFSSPPPPCVIDMGSQTANICAGETVDILTYFETGLAQGVQLNIYGTNGTPPDPYAVSEPGSYYFDGMDWYGCTYYGTYDVTVSPQIVLGPDQTVDQCGGDPVDLPALFNLNGVQTEWSLDGSPISAATAAASVTSGVYQLIGLNSGGCNDTALVTLNFSAGPALGPDQSVSICPGSSFDLNSAYFIGVDPAIWTFGGAPYLTPEAASDAGVYTLVVTTANGCTATAEVTLDVEVVSSIGADQVVDLCSNASLDLTTLYNTTGITAEWTLTGLPVADPSSVNVAGTYQLVASNGSGCSDTAFVSVNAVASPTLGQDLPLSICEGGSVDLTTTFNTSGLTGAWTYSGAPVIDPTAIGIAGIYSLIATSSDGCVDTALVDLTVETNPVLGPDQALSICDGAELDLTALYSTGLDATEWTTNGSPVTDPTSVTNGGTYSVTASNASGCTSTALVTVSLDPSPAMGGDQMASICEGSSFDLITAYPSTGLTEEWTLNGSPVADPSAVYVTGNYELVVTNNSGCTDSAVLSLTVDPIPALGADLSFTLCPWQTVDLSTVFPVAGMSVVYTIDGVVVDDPSAVHDPGTYTVVVTNTSGCVAEATASVVNVDCLCEADFTEDANCVQEPVKFVLVADSMVLDAHWEFSGANTSTVIDPVVKFNTEGEVLVTLRATLACGEVNVQRTVKLHDCTDDCSVFIPSAFTPNNDAINDIWRWYGACEPDDFSVEVFDRFGEVIFASKDPTSAWDGTYGGISSPTGVYSYRVKYRLPYQEPQKVLGSITLLR